MARRTRVAGHREAPPPLPRSARAITVWTNSVANGPSAAASANGSPLGRTIRRSAPAAMPSGRSRDASQIAGGHQRHGGQRGERMRLP